MVVNLKILLEVTLLAHRFFFARFFVTLAMSVRKFTLSVLMIGTFGLIQYAQNASCWQKYSNVC